MEILFITTNNLVTNPRLVKEVRLALDNKFNPTVVCFDFDNWTTELEYKLRSSLKGVKFNTIKTGVNHFDWFMASAIHLFYKKLPFFVGSNIKLNAYASDKRSYLIYKCLKGMRRKYDLIISHNLGALFPAHKLSEEKNIPFAFDIEDFHPGEAIKEDTKNEIFRREQLMRKLLPKASYLSYASPLIGVSTLELINAPISPKYLLINNSFSSSDFQSSRTTSDKKISFVWFSQNISYGRGLELIIPVLYNYRCDVHITLIGNLNSSFFDIFLKDFIDVISIIDPLSQKDLHARLADFDIGLASDLSSTDSNRDLCLTNKIFAYSQAGLFILATNTLAQELFIKEHPQLGTLVDQSSEGIKESIKEIISKKERIRADRELRFTIGNKLSWENESKKLLEVWATITNQS